MRIMKMKYQYLSFLLCLCCSFASMSLTAQSSNSNCSHSKTQCSSKSYNMNISIKESNDNNIYSLGYAKEYTDEVEALLIQKLGRRYSKAIKGSKKWDKDYTVISKNGHASITYNGTNEATKDQAKALFNDIIAAVKSEKG